ncbi:hypothetical protein N7510_009955 [Penicillium lagena]|uniref:uncharacterized protein n=1 Tax=Penicillium lagena TaxID=94218 RepID=UPI002541CB5D|nr:uncharacterized protein N7510_009955 [Penicillium lagena]KAJ5604801.1 hypothetical protein N7510_009955 [Penicillium lagena]
MASSDPLAQAAALSGLHAFVRPLSVADVKSCVEVENAFVEHERCSEEKFVYRLTRTPELALGLFIQTSNGSPRLIGHVIANRSSASAIQDTSMEAPKNWQSLSPDRPVVVDGHVIGNDPRGKNIAIHSVAVIPEFQGKGTGKALVQAYVEYIRNAGIPAQRIMLIAHDYLIRFYESAGFENRGISQSRYAGETWFDLVSLGRDLCCVLNITDD